MERTDRCRLRHRCRTGRTGPARNHRDPLSPGRAGSRPGIGRRLDAPGFRIHRDPEHGRAEGQPPRRRTGRCRRLPLPRRGALVAGPRGAAGRRGESRGPHAAQRPRHPHRRRVQRRPSGRRRHGHPDKLSRHARVRFMGRCRPMARSRRRRRLQPDTHRPRGRSGGMAHERRARRQSGNHGRDPLHRRRCRSMARLCPAGSRSADPDTRRRGLGA